MMLTGRMWHIGLVGGAGRYDVDALAEPEVLTGRIVTWQEK